MAKAGFALADLVKELELESATATAIPTAGAILRTTEKTIDWYLSNFPAGALLFLLLKYYSISNNLPRPQRQLQSKRRR